MKCTNLVTRLTLHHCPSAAGSTEFKFLRGSLESPCSRVEMGAFPACFSSSWQLCRKPLYRPGRVKSSGDLPPATSAVAPAVPGEHGQVVERGRRPEPEWGVRRPGHAFLSSDFSVHCLPSPLPGPAAWTGNDLLTCLLAFT